MTREVTIAYIREWLKDEYALNYKDKEALNKAIKALEQEPIIDKIRAEIIHDTESIINRAIVVGMKRAVEIIDKYKAESEE